MGGKATWKIKFARHKTSRALSLSDPVKFLVTLIFAQFPHCAKIRAYRR